MTTTNTTADVRLEELFRDHHRWALALARRTVTSSADAEDVVSAVFEATHRALHAGRHIENPRAYLRIALRHEAQRLYARRGIEVVTDNLPKRPAPDRHGELERALARRDALEGRPAAWRDMLWLVDVNGFSTAEAAAHLGTTASAAVSVLHRVRGVLREGN